jgi:hypothetical protein
MTELEWVEYGTHCEAMTPIGLFTIRSTPVGSHGEVQIHRLYLNAQPLCIAYTMRKARLRAVQHLVFVRERLNKFLA